MTITLESGPSDYEKLMDVAMYLDILDAKKGIINQDDVQKDIRRIAKRLLELDGTASFTLEQKP
jgi:hypothetical protein